MVRVLKGGALLLGAVFLLLLLSGVAMHITMGFRLRRVFNAPTEIVPVTATAERLARGRRLVAIGRCTECHGANLGGRLYIDDPAMGQIYASNLTSGRGGVGGRYTDEEWVRAIRHGVRPDGRTLIVTPANYYYHLSDEDLGAIIAYLKSVRPVDREHATPRNIGPLGRIFVTLSRPPDWLPAEKIDHIAPRPTPPSPGPTAAYGGYLWKAATCGVCHQAPVLAAEMAAAGYTQQDFGRVLRRGVTPSGRHLDNEIMPFANTVQMTNDELAALWHYVQAQPLAP